MDLVARDASSGWLVIQAAEMLTTQPTLSHINELYQATQLTTPEFPVDHARLFPLITYADTATLHTKDTLTHIL